MFRDDSRLAKLALSNSNESSTRQLKLEANVPGGV